MSKRQDLLDVVAGGEKLSNGCILLAAGPILHQPWTTPFRVILALRPEELGGPELIVWNQQWETSQITYDNGRMQLPPQKCSFGQGDYFKPKQLDVAIARMCARMNNSENIKSVLRPEHPE